MSQTVPTARAARAHVRIPNHWISTPTAAERAQVATASIIRWASDGLLSGRKVVGRWRIDPQDLERLLTGREAASE